MKIALLGYGKMGKTIERIASERGHQIILRKNESERYLHLEQADVAIDFSVPSAAFEHISTCLQSGIPVVSGTTGWLSQFDDAVTLCQNTSGAFLYASNFSLGVNLFFNLNTHLAKLMRNFPDYKIAMEEIHHTQKLDAPSGTAISLAKAIIAQTDYTGFSIEKPTEKELPIHVQRIDNIPGTHAVYYKSVVDTIEIKHTAHNRDGFALGAIIAAEWLVGKTGVYTMADVLEL